MESKGPQVCSIARPHLEAWTVPSFLYVVSSKMAWSSTATWSPKARPGWWIVFFFCCFFWRNFFQNNDLKSGWGNMLNNASPQIFWKSWSLKHFYLDFVFSNPLEQHPNIFMVPKVLLLHFGRWSDFRFFSCHFWSQKTWGFPQNWILAKAHGFSFTALGWRFFFLFPQKY